MKSAGTKYLELVERRLELVRTLIRTGKDWREAFIALKMEESERYAADEEMMCHQIKAIDRQIENFGSSSTAVSDSLGAQSPRANHPIELDPAVESKIRAAVERMATLHLELKQSNEIRNGILKRSRLTIRALHNLFNSYAPTYGAPAGHRMGSVYEESV